MADQRLTIHFPNAVVAIESDNMQTIEELAFFLRKELKAYSYRTQNELTVDNLNEEMSSRFHSVASELGLF